MRASSYGLARGRLARVAAVAFLACRLAAAAAAEEVWHPEDGWGANPPETWSLLGADERLRNVNFADSRGHALFQVFAVDDARAAADRLAAASKAAEAEAGSAEFSYCGMPARLSDLTWTAGKTPVRGYLLSIQGEGRGFVLVCYAQADEWPTYHDFLLSCLDSFFAGWDKRYLPGPISQLVAGDGWAGGPEKDHRAAVDASQNVADREARVLSAYVKAGGDAQRKAWRRFYQAIYRDSYHRLDAAADAMARSFEDQKIGRAAIPAALLAWIQSFKFEEYTTLSDIRVPVDALERKAGDCDGRGLIYAILLDHLGIESILMVSSAYHHSMVGVAVDGPGYYFPQDGKRWLFAETTVAVPLGQIRSDMTDPKQWLGFDLRFTP